MKTRAILKKVKNLVFNRAYFTISQIKTLFCCVFISAVQCTEIFKNHSNENLFLLNAL